MSRTVMRNASKHPRQSGFAPEVVALIIERDRGRCARCGQPVRLDDRGASWSIHHRAPRGAGGSRVDWVNGAANGVILCGSGTTGCHGWVEAHRAEARDTGWLVSRIGRDRSTDIPVSHAVHGFVRLLDDGGVTA